MTPTENLLQQLAAQAQTERQWEDAIFRRVTEVIGRYAAARAEMIALLGPVLTEAAPAQPVRADQSPTPIHADPVNRIEAEFDAARREAREREHRTMDEINRRFQ